MYHFSPFQNRKTSLVLSESSIIDSILQRNLTIFQSDSIQKTRINTTWFHRKAKNKKNKSVLKH